MEKAVLLILDVIVMIVGFLLYLSSDRKLRDRHRRKIEEMQQRHLIERQEFQKRKREMLALINKSKLE